MQIFFAIMSLLSQLPGIIKIIDQVVLSVEAAFPTASGPEKLKAATAKINSIVNAASVGADAASALAVAVTPLVNASVAAFNATQVFKPSTPAAGTPAA